MIYVLFSVRTQAYSKKENPSAPIRSQTFDLPITSSDTLPLSYRRLVGTKAIKLLKVHVTDIQHHAAKI